MYACVRIAILQIEEPNCCRKWRIIRRLQSRGILRCGIPYLIYCLDYSHFVMLNRQQAYTGITRAKKQAVLIIETKASNRAVRTNHVVHKRTFLYHFLVGELPISG